MQVQKKEYDRLAAIGYANTSKFPNTRQILPNFRILNYFNLRKAVLTGLERTPLEMKL